MNSGKRNALNLSINWASFAATGVVLFFLSPFVIHTLGPVEYGIWSLLNVLTGYMGILDLGVRSSTGRHIFLYLGRDDHQAVDQTIRTSLGFFSCIGLLIFAVAGLLGWVFPQAFSSVPIRYHSMLMWMVPLMAINVWTSAVAAVFSSVLVAHERFDLARGVDILTLAVRTVATVWVLNTGFGIIGLAFIVVLCNLIPLICNVFLAKHIYVRLRYWPFLLNGDRLRELSGFGLAAFIATVSVKLIGQTDLIVVGSAISVAAVTVYSVGAMLVYYSENFVGQIGATFWPSLQKAVARNEMGSARWIFFRQVRLASLVGIPLYVGFILYAEAFIRLWMFGPNFDEQSVKAAAIVMGILAGAQLLRLFCIGAGPLLACMGHVRFNAAISASEALVNLCLSLGFVFIAGWGLWGVALGTLVSRFVVVTFPLPWYACRKANIIWWDYAIQIGGRGMIAVILFSVWCYFAQILIPCSSWTMFFASVGISIAGFFPIGILLLLPSEDFHRVKNRMRPLRA